jgi:translation initiation factor IF-1
MKVRVYFSKEPDTVEIILKTRKISRQALDTIYELVWECEFKNILNAGRVWLKLKEDEERPFGIPLREKRTHTSISPGDIIQITNDFYVVDQIGARKVEVID